jgi:hypothetical protein
LIDGSYLRDPRGQYFCASHKIVPCRFCERGFEPSYGVVADRCPSCSKIRVVHSDEAHARYKFVTDWYGSEELTFPSGVPPLRLEDHMPTAPNGRPMLGFADKRFFGFNAKSGKVQSISVQSGLPRFLFGVVIAHELGHVYLVQRGASLSERMEEGICDWLAHAFALRVGTDDLLWTARRIERNPDPVNGDGFRRFRALAGHSTPRELPRLLTLLARDANA